MGLFSGKPKPHITYEVSEKNKTLRMILIVVLLAIGVVAITTGIITALNSDSGWQEVTVTSQERNCSTNFIFQYYFADSGAAATELNRKVSAVYNAATVKAYWLFTPDEGSESYQNIYYINHHPGEVITVDPVLYNAFAKLHAQQNRSVYLGPAYAEYNRLFFNPDDSQVFEQDPAVNALNREYLKTVAQFASDPSHIELKLLGNNQVKLELSQTYQDFAKEYEIDCFLDFHYMANAFIIDYFADELIAQGFTHGYISSVDGYTRNLWGGGDSFSMNLFDLEGTTIYPAGTFSYQGPMSIVSLRSFPLAASDVYYREGANKTILHPYLSLETGMPLASTSNLLGLSHSASCADILLHLQKVFISDTFDEMQLHNLPFDAIWCKDGAIRYTLSEITFSKLFHGDSLTYTAIYAD